jgi:proteasome lid subunit RPN8/RPN11
VILEDKIKAEFEAHAKHDAPQEACGLLIIRKGKQHYHPAKNLAIGTDNFIIDPKDYEEADRQGEIVGVIHSHPKTSSKPSQADLVSCEASNLPWFIYAVAADHWNRIEPSGYQAPLVGRQWSHGVLDCYAIIRDWYKQELNIDLLDFHRSDLWWERGQNLYIENFEKAGFKRIDPELLDRGDGILMTVNSKVPNHAAVYLGDGVILHHVQGRLSTRDVYGGYWQKNTIAVVRYERNKTIR